MMYHSKNYIFHARMLLRTVRTDENFYAWNKKQMFGPSYFANAPLILQARSNWLKR